MTTASQALSILEDIDQREPTCNVAVLSMALHDDPERDILATMLFDALLERGICPNAASVIVHTAREVGRDARDMAQAAVAIDAGTLVGWQLRRVILRRHPVALPSTPIDVVAGNAASRLVDPTGESGDRIRYVDSVGTHNARGRRRFNAWLQRLRITVGARRVLELSRVIARELGDVR